VARRAGWGAWAIVLPALLAACGGSGFEYVTNSDEGLFFKIPSSWASLPHAEAEEDGVWARIVDGADDPAADHLDERLPAAPVGLAQVVPVGSQRDAVSLQFLRSLSFGADPLELAQQGDIRVLRRDDIVTEAGFRGERIAVTIPLDGGDEVTIDQIAMVDAATTTLYRLVIKCEAACYEAHRGEIDQIVDSWTLEER
jgi:hypothetical protein